MKKLFVLAFLFSSAIGFAQTIPNAGFETWAQSGPFLAPSDWATSPNVSQSTLAHAGSYAALLTVDTITNPQTSTVDTIGGLMYTGVQTQGPPPPPGTSYGGFPYTGRPDSLGGWLQYTGQQGDFFKIELALSKWNASSGTRDIIATATLSNDLDIPVYSYGNLALVYTSSATPDTAFIQFSVGDQVQRHKGSSLWVDDLAFITNSTSSVQAIQVAERLNIYPNPASETITLQAKTSGLHYTIEDMQGRILQVGLTSEAHTLISIADLNNGLYILRMQDGEVNKLQVIR